MTWNVQDPLVLESSWNLNRMVIVSPLPLPSISELLKSIINVIGEVLSLNWSRNSGSEKEALVGEAAVGLQVNVAGEMPTG